MYWRRRLPHWIPEDAQVFITWRLSAQGFWLTHPKIAPMIKEALEYGRNIGRYDLLAWVIMPDHVHVVIKPIQPLDEIMRWLKSATANRANAALARAGHFWAREYYDRWVRTDKELDEVIAYIEDNPVRKGLSACAENWRWSSAFEEKAPATRSPALPER